MKLTKKEAQEIADQHSLGKITKLKQVKEGWVNTIFSLKTEKGNFMLRSVGTRKQNVIKAFQTVSYLKKRKFPYQIPNPIKNNKGQNLSKKKGTFFWIYPRIDGSSQKRLGEKQTREVAKALATYHQYIQGANIGEKETIKAANVRRLLNKMAKEKKKDKLGKFITKNIEFMQACLERVKHLKVNSKIIPIHADFHEDNLLWESGKVTGILDFDNIVRAPRIRDLVQTIKAMLFKEDKLDRRRYQTFLREYQKHNKLTKEEQSHLLPYILLYACYRFTEFYGLTGKKSDRKSKLILLKWCVNVARGTVKEL